MSPDRERELRTRLQAALALRDSVTSSPDADHERELEETLVGLVATFRSPELTSMPKQASS